MNIVFFGNADISSITLDYLVSNDIIITSVITNIDKKIGRGLKLKENPVKQKSKELQLDYFECDSFNNKTIEYLKSLNPDLFVVVAYKILPQSILEIPNFGSINLHTSILPKYRGASPIQMTLLNGDANAGVTTFFLNKLIDKGDIILQRKIEIDDLIKYEELYLLLSNIGSELLYETINLISLKLENNLSPDTIKQDNSNYSNAPKITKNMLKINWEASAFSIHNKIRALSYIGVYSYLNERRVQLYDSYFDISRKHLPSGYFELYNDEYISIGTGNGLLLIKKIKFEGKKLITAKDFINSNVKEKFFS